MKHSFFARKTIEELAASASPDHDEPRFERCLGPWSLMSLGVGAIIGAGIFVLTGAAAARYAGPAIVLSFMLAGFACAIVALCYAELAALIPVSGSTYSYVYATLGEIFAWIIGWDLVLEYAMGAATVAVGWSGYFVSLLGRLGLGLPAKFTAATSAALPGIGGNGPVQCSRGSHRRSPSPRCSPSEREESARFNNVMVGFKLAVVVTVIVVGGLHVAPANWTPFLPQNTGEFGHFGWSGVLRGGAVVFFAYIGFDAVSTAAQEAHRPQRDVPIGLIGALIVCTLLYIAVAAVITGVVPFPRLDVADPIAVAIDAIGLPALALVVKFAALAGLTTVILVLLFGQSRIIFAIASDGLLPALLFHPASALQNALDQPGHARPHRRGHGGSVPDRPARRNGQHRHAGRLRPGVPRRHAFAPHPARHPPPLSRSRFAGPAEPGHPRLPRPDGQPALGDLGATGGLARHWHGGLCFLRPPQRPSHERLTRILEFPVPRRRTSGN